MPDLPNLTTSQVAEIIPAASNIQLAGRGGQKLVFKAQINNTEYAIKFAKLIRSGLDDTEDFATTDTALRAKREVEIMRDCASPYMVKLGPLGLTFSTTTMGEELVYFSEEFIEGTDLKELLRTNGPFPPQDIAQIGRQIGGAIQALWEIGKVHRDIKPANIMKRANGGDYVLLDAGLAFDLDGQSLSVGVVGTPLYFSPEQFDFNNRRSVLDFRSDMFSLGTTMYYLATGVHPFWSSGDNSQAIYTKITSYIPPPPDTLVTSLPAQLSDIIMRLLGKSPHLRYRKCAQLIAALQGL